MKRISVLLMLLLLSTACRKGPQSKEVQLQYLDIFCDDSNCQSTSFGISIQNDSDFPLKDPYLKMVIKDTSSKLLFNSLYRNSDKIPDVPAHSSYTHYFNTGGFEYSAEVSKRKIRLDWTNNEGTNSWRREIENF